MLLTYSIDSPVRMWPNLVVRNPRGRWLIFSKINWIVQYFLTRAGLIDVCSKLVDFRSSKLCTLFSIHMYWCMHSSLLKALIHQ